MILAGLAPLIAAFCLSQTPDASVVVKQEPPPSAEELRRVIDYYYNGKQRGPALVELKACLKVDADKQSSAKNECIEVANAPVAKNTIVHGWTLWYLPEGGDYDDVSLQFVHEGQVRSTIDLKLNTAGRTRTWRSTTATKPGKWVIRVVRGTQELGMTTFTVLP